MLISGVVILTERDHTKSVLEELQNLEQVTTYGVHHECYIVAVLEADSSKDMESLSDKISKSISGVIGVFPAYVNFEAENQAI